MVIVWIRKKQFFYSVKKINEEFMEIIVLLCACCFAAIAGSTAIVEAIKEDKPQEECQCK